MARLLFFVVRQDASPIISFFSYFHNFGLLNFSFPLTFILGTFICLLFTALFVILISGFVISILILYPFALSFASILHRPFVLRLLPTPYDLLLTVFPLSSVICFMLFLYFNPLHCALRLTPFAIRCSLSSIFHPNILSIFAFYLLHTPYSLSHSSQQSGRPSSLICLLLSVLCLLSSALCSFYTLILYIALYALRHSLYAVLCPLSSTYSLLLTPYYIPLSYVIGLMSHV